MPTAGTGRWRRVQRHLRAAVTERLPLKLLALFFAIVLWVVVSAEEPAEEWVDARLVLQLDSTVALRDSALPRVQVLAVGRGRDLLKLYGEPPIVRHGVGPDVADRATLELRPSDVDVAAGVDVRVRDVRPHELTLDFRVMENRAVPVRSALSVMTDSGVRLIGAPRLVPETVVVRGPRGVVRTVDDVSTDRLAVQVHESTTLVVPLDTAGLAGKGVAITPPRVQVRIAAVRPPPLDSIAAPTEGPPAPARRAAHDSGRAAVHDSARRGPGAGAAGDTTRRARRYPATAQPSPP